MKIIGRVLSIFQNWPFWPDLAQIWPRFGQGLTQIWPKLCPFDPFCHWSRLKLFDKCTDSGDYFQKRTMS